jgi:nucleoid-associated protein YejK
MKAEKKKTSELLDATNHEMEDEEFDETWRELITRCPFDYITEQLDDMREKLDELEKEFRHHKHVETLSYVADKIYK